MITNPDILGRVCWNLANRLTDGRWILDEVQGTDFSRTVSEKIGQRSFLSDKEIMPTLNDIHIGFFASKEVTKGYRGNPVDIDSYQLSMSIDQTIDQSEIPPYVLDEIFEQVEELNDVHDEFDTEFDIPDRDNLDEFEVIRRQKITYDVSTSGEVTSYDLNYSYSIDDIEVHEVDYCSEYGARLTIPIKIGKSGEEVDQRPINVLFLTDAKIDTETGDLDTSWLEFINEGTLREITSFGAQSQSEHRHQALAMVGLLTSGIFTLKNLTVNT